VVSYRGTLGLGILILALVPFSSSQNAVRNSQANVGLPVDWSSRHVLHSNAVTFEFNRAARQDPRLLYNWMLRNRPRPGTAAATAVSAMGKKSAPMQVDWNFPLGAGTVPFSMFPAKFSFDAGSGALTAANCTNDFLVYALNVAGSASQPNLVRFNNIYAGTGGFCGTDPTVLTAYSVNTLDATGTTPLGGVLRTSPALSLNGAKVAFIETVTGNTQACPGQATAGTCSIFHVLTWGTTGNNGSWDGTNRVYNATAPGSPNNNAAITTLVYSTSTNSFSSPWVDYSAVGGERAYFGDDSGKLYRTTCVFFCTSAPAIDTGWPITVAAGVRLGPPVMDAVSQKVFVGGSDGNLYMVDLALCPGVNCTLAGGGIKSLAVGSANTFGGVVDGPLVDSSFGIVFASAGDNGGGSGRFIETSTSFSFTDAFTMGRVAFFNIFAGAADDAYFQNIPGTTINPTGHIFSCGQLGGSGQPDLYWAPFTNPNAGTNTPISLTNPPRLNTGAVKNVNIPGNPGIGCTPLTEFKNGATDRLFFSQSSLPSKKCTSTSPANEGCAFMYNITTPTNVNLNFPAATAVENGGTSGIIIDNASPSPQASSIYFANQGTAACTTGTGGATAPSFCAIKLTQSALQ
jgi:hypothetical protein